MSGSYEQQQTSYGQLMESLLRERDRYASEEEFRAYAVDAVRRFIVDLRSLDIEIALRPHYEDRPAGRGTGRLSA
jgi:hypothetical protein